MTDEEQLAYGLRTGRVVLTMDDDLLVLHDSGVEHAGITFCLPESRTIGYVVRYLCLMHDCMTPEEMHGRVEFI